MKEKRSKERGQERRHEKPWELVITKGEIKGKVEEGQMMRARWSGVSGVSVVTKWE